MARKRSKLTSAQIIEYERLRIAAGGNGGSGDGPPSGVKIISLMGSLVRGRQGDLVDPSKSNKADDSPDLET